nr:PREDICTED: kinesin-like protein KIF28P [Latimeria chalumnae]|eukprot:XP_014342035.1 PREDICTED: kinesin-like protein KIF28P [Latimeria chalumnae]
MPNLDSVKVAVRVRPFNQREKDAGSQCVISMNSNCTTICDPRNPENRKSFTFDIAYWSHSGFIKNADGKFIPGGLGSRYADQMKVFNDLGQGVLDNAWQGYNATLLAYGQTGSGKSYSMIGYGANRGIIPIVCEELFRVINNNQDKNKQYQVSFSMLEIYNEQGETEGISKLVTSPATRPMPRTDRLNSPSDSTRLDCSTMSIAEGNVSMQTLLDNMNKNTQKLEKAISALGEKFEKLTSRLSAVGKKTDKLEGSVKDLSLETQRKRKALLEEKQKCVEINMKASLMYPVKLRLETSDALYIFGDPTDANRFLIFLEENITKQSSINMVDLAGSERQKVSGSEGDRLREGTAVNLSLTTLGNVISSLAEVAVRKRVLHIPYRDSVLTKLLQSALGGNSRTIMMAALSPADICYEETLSTLRYAERAKKIKNKAVVNKSPTEKLIKELKAENAKLLSKLARLGSSGKRVEDETRQLHRLLAENELQIQAIQVFWEQHLEEARREWEQQYAAIAQERRLMQMFPYLLNVNEDPQLSGVIKHFIQDGESEVGQSGTTLNAITLKGLGILDKHATFTNTENKVTIEPHGRAKVIVNGVSAVTKTQLRHLDRIILGSSNTYIYIGFPNERNNEDLSRFDYDFFQSELAAAEGINMDKLGAGTYKNGKTDPSVLAMFHDYIKVMPLVAEANQMSEELKKDLKFELQVKNLALSDSKGHDLEKEIAVKVTNRTNNLVWVWSKAKFINRKFLMEELYQRYMEGKDVSVDRVSDPFWDPVEAVHLGSAHVWLQSLAYCIKLEEQVEFLNSESNEEAMLQINLVPCSRAGEPFGEDDIMIDPSELLGNRLDFQIQINQCLGLKWLKQVRERGVQIGYRVYNCPNTFYMQPVWGNVNPKLHHVMHFTVLNVSQEFLSYLLTNALVVDLWGLQEGCTEMDCSFQDVRFTEEGSVIIDETKVLLSNNTETNENQLSELYLKLSKLEKEMELLRDVNRALREDNTILKGMLKKPDTEAPEDSNHGLKFSNKFRTHAFTIQPPALLKEHSQRGSLHPSYDAEFAKALKAFYQSMNSVRGQLDEGNLQTLELFMEEQAQMLKDFGEQLEVCVNKLKNDVATIVKKKRDSLGCIKP